MSNPFELTPTPTPTVTLKTLVRHTGLSLGTVSKALKNAPEVKPETRERVQRAAAELGYSVNLAGVKLRTGKTYTLCIVLPVEDAEQDFSDSGYMALVSGLYAALAGSYYSLVVHPQLPGESPLEGLRQLVESRRVDGLILTQTRPQDERIRYLLQQDMPFVSYGRSELAQPHPWFDTDHEDMAYQATRRLIERGHRRIAMLNPSPELMYARHREQGYRRALALAGIEFEADLLRSSGLSAGDGRRITLELSQRKQRPTAFVCANEFTALGALSAFAELGWQAGREAAVVATDDSNISAFFVPPISTYFASLHHAGRQLGSLLLRRLGGEAVERLQILECAELIERQSDLAVVTGATE
ncbi:LacI family DNA-binding transcriptional regulator [Roseateles oligotrophus]|uniref:LacI family DNA-binding transcriptional regulator n=1 Tax=Roseateles oligotrophus TaxID=1769250 RepID=A0ABT2YHW2_9BURK|nr:LacI family DNA-binding transcriptional regulator [Roseateles oligotrophus]MCV2369636.1 LacI family DNA-binding transcriptional regulator [Roseateles oligotrophus]